MKRTSGSLVIQDADTKPRTKRPIKSASKKKTVTKKVTKETIKKAPKKSSKTSLKTKSTAKIRDAKIVKPTKKKAPAKKSPAKQKFEPVSIRVDQKTITDLKRHPLGHLLIEKNLREAGFRGGISTDKKYLEKYSTDESIFSIKPQVVLQPKNGRDVEIATNIMKKESARFPSISLTPRAAGTGLSGGSLTDSIVIDMCAHMHNIGNIKETNDGAVFTCEPGAMWRTVEKRLRKYKAYIPSYPASKDLCSIGGSIANNAAGPDSLRYGHCADWVESLRVVFQDGKTYTIKPLTYKEFSNLIKQDNEHARIAKEIFDLIVKNETEIKKAQPKTRKNSAGYPLWSVLDTNVKDFKKGTGHFDLTRLISGSQGTIGIITEVTMRAIKIPTDTTLISIPVFNLADAGDVVQKALQFNPINVEVFDGLSFDLAMSNPQFFKDRISGINYYKIMLAMYTTYHVRYGRKTPEFTLLVTLDKKTTDSTPLRSIAKTIGSGSVKARVVKNPIEREMLWQVRRASYSLSKFQDPDKRPAAFLEDMTVPPEHLAKFFMEIKKLLKRFNVTAAVHGHGGNGHFHFYPLLDFTKSTTPKLVEQMSEDFFSTAIKYDGNICGEHNDGIIRTPHLNKMFTAKTIKLFEKVENIFDPQDIFNPGKKVKPRYDIKDCMRTTN